MRLVALLITLSAAIPLWSVQPVLAAEQFAPKYVNDASEICVERRENDGLLNIVPVTVIVSKSAKLTLLGGQAGCLFVPAGKQTIQLSFPYPYAGPSAPPSWVTQDKPLPLVKNTIAVLELCSAPNQNVNSPSWAKTGWHSMWQLEDAKAVAQCASK
jgi:hypothetical protein